LGAADEPAGASQVERLAVAVDQGRIRTRADR
jgi:hypothetical protein